MLIAFLMGICVPSPSDLRGAILASIALALAVAFLCLCLARVKGCGRFGSTRSGLPLGTRGTLVRVLVLRVAFAPLKRFLAGDFVRSEVRHLFLGNNSLFRRGYLGKQLPQLPHAKKRVISEKLVAENETASDAFLNLNRPFSAVSKPPPAPVMRPENYIVV